jgi:hypothetical protein
MMIDRDMTDNKLRGLVRMNHEVVRAALDAFHLQDDDQMNELYAVICSNSSDASFSDVFVHAVLDGTASSTDRSFIVTVLRNCNCVLSDANIRQLLPVLSSSDAVLVGSIGTLLAPIIQTDELLELLLSLPDSRLGVLVTLLHFPTIPPVALKYLIDGFGSDINVWIVALNARVLSKLDAGSDDGLSDAAMAFFTAAVNANFLPVYSELLPLFKTVDESQAKLDICVQRLSDLSQLVPFPAALVGPDQTRYTFSNLCIELVGIVESMVAQEMFEIDMQHYSQLLFTLSIASDHEYESWLTNVDDFVNSTFVFSDDVFNLGSFVRPFLRAECVEALRALVLEQDILAACHEQMLASPRHQEAAYYIVAACSEFGTQESDVPEPVDDADVILRARYLLCLARLRQPIDLQGLADCLQSEAFQLKLTAAYILSRNVELYQPLLFVGVQAIAPILDECETSVIIELLDLFERIGRNVTDTAEMVAVLCQKWEQFVLNTAVSGMIAAMLPWYLEHFPAVFEVALPLVLKYLERPGREAAYSLLNVFVCRLPDDVLPLPDDVIDSLFHVFVRSLAEDLNDEAAISVAAYFARTGRCHPFDQLLGTIRMSRRIGDLAIALFVYGDEESKRNVIQRVGERFFEGETTERVQMCAILQFLFINEPFDFPWGDVVPWIVENAYHFQILRFDTVLCYAFLLAVPMELQLLQSVFESLGQYLRSFGIRPDQEEAKAWHFSIVNPMIAQHPLYEMDVPAFVRTHLAERTDLPPDLMLHVARFLPAE